VEGGIVIAAGLVIIDPQQAAAAAAGILGRSDDCRMAAALLDPFADLVMVGGGLGGRHVASPLPVTDTHRK